MALDCRGVPSVGNSRSASDPKALQLLWLTGGDFCGDILEVWLLAGDDELEPKASIVSSIVAYDHLSSSILSISGY